jgi:6-phosphogluconolactonase
MVQIQDKGINWPRDFNIDPTGTFLLAENLEEDNIIVFTIDHDTGKLVETEYAIEISKPLCIVFLEE